MAKKHSRVETFWSEDFMFGRYYYGFVPCEAAWHKTIKRLCPQPKIYPVDHAGHMFAFNDRWGKRCALVTVRPDIDKTAESIQIVGIMAHEALHIVHDFCEVLGEEKRSLEFEPHFLQGITQELLEGYCQTRRNLFLPRGRKK